MGQKEADSTLAQAYRFRFEWVQRVYLVSVCADGPDGFYRNRRSTVFRTDSRPDVDRIDGSEISDAVLPVI